MLRDLIPAEFFIPPPSKVVPINGTVRLLTGPAFKGDVLVAWGKGCPLFNENLATARNLKAKGFGTYRPEVGGWVFFKGKALEVIAAFPQLMIAPNVAEAAKPAIQAAIIGERILHGTIKLDGRQWLVSFGNGYNISPNKFAEYLGAARSIKQHVQGCRGWQGKSKVWSFAREAAARIIKSFPAAYFDHPADLLKDAEISPVQNTIPVQIGSDPLAEKLLAAAEKLFA